MSAPGITVWSVWVDERRCGRMVPSHQMVIDHDDGQANRLGLFQRADCRRATIHRDDEFGALILQVPERCGRRAVALLQPIRHIEAEVFAPCPEVSRQDGGAGAAIDIVICKDRDALLLKDGVEDNFRRLVHVGKAGGVRECLPQGGRQIGRGLFRGDIARGQQAGQQVRSAHTGLEATHQGLIHRRKRPEPARGRSLHVEQRIVLLEGRISHEVSGNRFPEILTHLCCHGKRPAQTFRSDRT